MNLAQRGISITLQLSRVARGIGAGEVARKDPVRTAHVETDQFAFLRDTIRWHRVRHLGTLTARKDEMAKAIRSVA